MQSRLCRRLLLYTVFTRHLFILHSPKHTNILSRLYSWPLLYTVSTRHLFMYFVPPVDTNILSRLYSRQFSILSCLEISILEIIYYGSHDAFLCIYIIGMERCVTLCCLLRSIYNIFISISLSYFLYPSLDDATRVILKSTDDYINANYINVSLFLLLFLCLSPVCLSPGCCYHYHGC